MEAGQRAYFVLVEGNIAPRDISYFSSWDIVPVRNWKVTSYKVSMAANQFSLMRDEAFKSYSFIWTENNIFSLRHFFIIKVSAWAW